MAEARPLVIAERGKECVALTAKDQPRGTSPGKLLKEGFLAHCGQDLLEDFGTEPRRISVGQVLVRYPLIGDELQRCGRRSRPPQCPAEYPDGGKCHAEKSPQPFANGFCFPCCIRRQHL